MNTFASVILRALRVNAALLVTGISDLFKSYGYKYKHTVES